MWFPAPRGLNRRSPIINPKSKTENRSRLSKFVSPFVRTYPDLCRDLRRHARLRLNLNLDLHPDLNLYLYLYLNLSLNLNLFLIQKPFEASFGSPFGFK